MKNKQTIDWKNTKAVIFDVDGTLYPQSKLRKKMLFALLRYYAFRPWQMGDILIIHHFRAEREKKAGSTCGNIEQAQYEWCAEKGNYSLSRIRRVIDYWMFNFPNKFLLKCMYPGVKSFFEALKKNNIKVGVYSDYKAVEKIKAMGLHADIVVCSTDKEIDSLKPNPKGLLYIAENLGFTPEECLFIGDRPELDGECAISANMPYLIVEKKAFDDFDFYRKIEEEISNYQHCLEKQAI